MNIIMLLVQLFPRDPSCVFFCVSVALAFMGFGKELKRREYFGQIEAITQETIIFGMIK